jgi:hypothetical protein
MKDFGSFSSFNVHVLDVGFIVGRWKTSKVEGFCINFGTL